MKKITLLAIAALAISFASCKKDYTCTCTAVGSTNASVTKLVGVSKKTAQANCVSYVSTTTGAGGSDIDDVTCTLSK